jgi:hypothetical protein
MLRSHSTKCDAKLAVNKKTNWLRFSRANEGQGREKRERAKQKEGGRDGGMEGGMDGGGRRMGGR